eukprot:scaffold90906_cov22-Tisochrysis_lutea.AAC.4
MSDTIPTPSLSLPSANVLGRAQGHKSTLQHRYFKVATTLKGRAQFRSKLSYAPFGAASVPKTLGLLLLGEGMGLDDIPKDTLEDCCQLVKHNSIQGEGRNKPDP